MRSIYIVDAEERLIPSYWETFSEVVREEKYLSMEQPYPLDRSMAFYKKGIERGYPYFFAVNNQDQVVGWCDVTPEKKEDGETAGVLGIGIGPEYRDQGLGRRMLETALEGAWKYGLKVVELQVRGTNLRAFHLYRSLGFVETARIKEGFEMKGRKEDVIHMRFYLERQAAEGKEQVGLGG